MGSGIVERAKVKDEAARDPVAVLPEERRSLGLKVGDWVVVRPAHEILATLDRNACFDNLPFMPQMYGYCGKHFRVRKSAHKMCDTVFATGARQMTDAVFLDDVLCDGAAFGGCEMACSIVWKEAWLRRVEDKPAVPQLQSDARLEALAWSASRTDQGAAEPIYSCQATKLPAATRPLPWWSVHQYVVDFKSGNVGLSAVAARFLFVLYAQLVASGLGFGAPLRWFYNVIQSLRGEAPFPVHAGRIRAGAPTPTVNLGLQEGDLVRIKSVDQILETVDKNMFNRGLSFHAEFTPYCGKTFRVKQRVRKLINEKTGRLVTLKNSCIILDGVICHGRFTQPINCPRAMPPYWREIWLERVDTGVAPEVAVDAAKPSVGCPMSSGRSPVEPVVPSSKPDAPAINGSSGR